MPGGGGGCAATLLGATCPEVMASYYCLIAITSPVSSRFTKSTASPFQ